MPSHCQAENLRPRLDIPRIFPASKIPEVPAAQLGLSARVCRLFSAGVRACLPPQGLLCMTDNAGARVFRRAKEGRNPAQKIKKRREEK